MARTWGTLHLGEFRMKASDRTVWERGNVAFVLSTSSRALSGSSHTQDGVRIKHCVRVLREDGLRAKQLKRRVLRVNAAKESGGRALLYTVIG
jgi:hypothetical protein